MTIPRIKPGHGKDIFLPPITLEDRKKAEERRKAREAAKANTAPPQPTAPEKPKKK